MAGVVSSLKNEIARLISPTAAPAIGLGVPKSYGLCLSLQLEFPLVWGAFIFCFLACALLASRICPKLQQSWFPLLLQNAHHLRKLHKSQVPLSVFGEYSGTRSSIIAQPVLDKLLDSLIPRLGSFVKIAGVWREHLIGRRYLRVLVQEPC